MLDIDRYKTCSLDKHSDKDLRQICVRTKTSAKGLKNIILAPASAVAVTRSGASTIGYASTALEEQQEQASTVIVSALGDKTLHVVCKIISEPNKMKEKLKALYASKKTSSKISTTVELVSVTYKSPAFNIAKLVDRVAGLVQNLANMSAPLQDTVPVGLLVGQVDAPKFSPVAASIWTPAEGPGIAECCRSPYRGSRFTQTRL